MSHPPSGPVLRIGLLHQYRLATSGSGVYLSRLVDQLVRRGHDVTVFSHDEPDADICGTRCRTVTLRGAGTPVAYPRADEAGSTLFSELSDDALRAYLGHSLATVETAVRRHGIEVLHVNSEVPLSAVAAELRRRVGIPYVVVGHGSTLEYVVRSDPRFRELCRAGFTGASLSSR